MPTARTTGATRFLFIAIIILTNVVVAFAQTTTPQIFGADATAITTNSAELHGYVNPNGRSTAVWFEWGTSTTSLTNETEHRNVGDGATPLTFAQTISNLQPHTVYYFRSAGRSGDGVIVRTDVRTFTTLSPATTTTPVNSTISTGEVTALAATSAELHGTVNPGGVATAVWFEWAATTAFANETEHRNVGDGSTNISFALNINRLTAATTYYYRAVAQNSRGTIRDDIRSFTTTRVTSTSPEPIREVEQGSVQSGYVIITPATGSAAPTALLTFATIGGGSTQSQAGVGPSAMTTDASVFVEVIPQISRNIGVAITNPGSTVNTVTLTLRDDDGIVVGAPASVTIQPRQQIARFVNELFGGDAIGTGFIGSLRMQSATPFAALGLRFTGTVFSALPVTALGSVSAVPVNGAMGGANALLMGQFALAGGWATHVALVNNTNATITGRIDILNTSGNPLTVKLNGETKSTFTYTIPAGGTFVLAPRDANGQSPM